jgi:hypothetical protein
MATARWQWIVDSICIDPNSSLFKIVSFALQTLARFPQQQTVPTS